MNTKPNVSRFADREKITIPPNAAAKAEEEKDDYKFTVISRGHFACDSLKATHIIIDKDGKIGCSCGDMTYRCTNNTVCKHIAIYLDLKVPPQTPAPGELIKKLMLMGWVGGKDDLHPAELLKPAHNTPSEPAPADDMVHYECPKCGEAVDIEPNFLSDWKLDHLDDCPGKKAGKQSPPQDLMHEPDDPEYPEPAIPELPDPPSEECSNCSNVEAVAPWVPGIFESDEHVEPPLPSLPPEPTSPETVPTNLAGALCNMQKTELFAVNDSENPFFKSMYADLASIWTAIRKPLTDNGLAIIQSTENFDGGITVITKLMHTSGESIETRLSAKLDKQTLQGLGSAMTYLRRYSLASLVGVASVDDDAEAAMKR